MWPLQEEMRLNCKKLGKDGTKAMMITLTCPVDTDMSTVLGFYFKTATKLMQWFIMSDRGFDLLKPVLGPLSDDS
jgi:hypothetical protein